MASLPLDCSDLTYTEIDELSSYLDSLPGIEVGTGPMSSEAPSDGTITIHAAREYIVIPIHFIQSHWTQITGTASAIGGTVKGYKWLSKQIREWNEKRNDGYEFVPIYDKHSNVLSVVKRKKA
jgi:hypothetical protein